MPDSTTNTMFSAMTTSAWGMRAQGERTRVIAENIANAQTSGTNPNEMPYARKTITFENEVDRASGQTVVKVGRIQSDKNADFPIKYMPDHPAADAQGNVKMPNVNMLVEINDMREAQRSYEANLSMMENSRNLANRTIDILR